ncbi:helix-turn-helix domain-containing protein [Intestinimonas massiliensis (ex Afouda et al. 2020)]|uniref:helix-turn-helix domain-containing protein n=1 Tax=Intestinimonas massiliensis (ex Afouda et al. 2020) TaxID=1673721 RepID=UPI0010307BD5|nr:helix-turn-helix transcriptional regulator [Intestinimonas massiliensis (ex Afouda et al. 2020)]
MRIKELREAMGLTRVQLADRLGVSVVAVRKWELGMAKPNADKLPALADLLHCTIDALYGREISKDGNYAAS